MLGSTADIDFVLEEAGEAVTYGLQSCFGLLDRTPINEIIDQGIREIGSNITLAIKHDALNALANDAAISVAGAEGGNFIIRDIGAAQPDGLRVLTLVEDV